MVVLEQDIEDLGAHETLKMRTVELIDFHICVKASKQADPLKAFHLELSKRYM